MKRKITCLLLGDEYRYTCQRKEHWWNRWHYIYDGRYPRLFTLADLIKLHIISTEEYDEHFLGNSNPTIIL